MKESDFRDRAALVVLKALVRKGGWQPADAADVALSYADAMVAERRKRVKTRPVKMHLLQPEGPYFTYCGLPDPTECEWPKWDAFTGVPKEVTCDTCRELYVERLRTERG